MQVKKIDEVPAAEVTMTGAQDVQVRVIFGPLDNAPTFAMRQFELQPGGCTPLHTHPFEHEVIVMQGELILVSTEKEQAITVGHAVLIDPDETHQFRNPSESQIAKMICLVPVEYQK